MKSGETKDRLRLPLTLALHPFFLLSLLLLIINDHLLKLYSPSWLTGKLSDVAGLIVVAVFLSIVFRGLIVNRVRLLTLHFTIGALFIIWKIGPIQAVIDGLNDFVGMSLVNRTVDSTDLLALPSLILSYWFLQRAALPIRYSCVFSWRQIGASVALIFAGFAVMATTVMPRHSIEAERYISRSDRTEPEMLFEVERALLKSGFNVSQRWSDGCCSFTFELDLDTVLYKQRADTVLKKDKLSIHGRLVMSRLPLDSIGYNVRIDFRTNKRGAKESAEYLTRIDSIVEDAVFRCFQGVDK